MGLIERLMRLDSETDDRHIAVHQFFAAATEINAGQATRQQMKNFYSMTSADEADFDAIADTVTGGSAARALQLQRIHAVFMLAETSQTDSVPGYDTPAAVRGKLGI